MGAELRQYDDYPEMDAEDLDFIRELEAEEEEILTGHGYRNRHVTREVVPELKALRNMDDTYRRRTYTGSGRTTERSAATIEGSESGLRMPGTRKHRTVMAEARPTRPTRPSRNGQVRPARPERAATEGGSARGEGAPRRRPSGGRGGKKSLSNKFDTAFQNNKPLFFLISRAMIPFIFFYYEVIFNLTTVRDFFGMHAIFILLFSIFFGMIGSILSSISRSRKVNMIVKAVVIFLPVIPFLVEYFVYLQFKVFYDLNTVIHGAADAAGGFKADIFRLITSFQGITHIILYLLPTVAFIIFELKIDKKHLLSLKTGWRRKVKMGVVTIASYLVALILIMCIKSYREVYTDKYYFESAVTDFGFMTGLRKEVRRKMTNADQKRGFDVAKVDDSTTGEPAPGGNTPTEGTSGSAQASEVATTEQKKTYMPNRYPISFSELAQKDEGTYADLDEYVASLNATMQNDYTGIFKGKNLIFLSAEAFSGDIIDPKLTPTLYRLSTKGINFTDYYQQATAGTTGGEYQNIMGMLPTMGGQSMKQTADYNNYFTMGSQLNRLGYYGKSYHNNDYTYYSRQMTHINLGYSDGFEGVGNGAEEYISGGWPESDVEMIKGTIGQYINKQPFNVYYMTVSGHSIYGRDVNAMSKKHWSQVENMPYSEPVKGYIAANLELEDALTYLVDNLEKAGIADDTVIVLAADHFPYGLDNDAALGEMPYLSELYGYNVTNYMQRDHNRLIIWSGCLEKMDPIIVDTPVSSIDILPTLSNLFGTEWDSRLLPGRDVFSSATPIAFNLNYNWKTDKGLYVGGEFVPNNAAEKLPDDYVDQMSSLVSNKINYCYKVLETDYFGHLYNLGVFPEIKKEYDYTKNKGMKQYTPTTDLPGKDQGTGQGNNAGGTGGTGQDAGTGGTGQDAGTGGTGQDAGAGGTGQDAGTGGTVDQGNAAGDPNVGNADGTAGN